MGENNLAGEIPIELAQMSELVRLALNSNAIGRVIPSELGNLQNLGLT